MAWRERLEELPVSRRQLLTGAAVGGGLLVAWWAWPRSYDGALEPGPGEFGFGAWLTIASDGVVSVAVPQLEMGQGVTTLIPQIVAMEMGAEWRQVAVVPAPPNGAQANIPLAAKWAPLWSALPSMAEEPDSMLTDRFARDARFTATAEGTTLEAYEQAAREAGAAARAVLAMAAAEQWDVAWEECEVANGFVTHGDKQARFGELAGLAADFDPPDPPPLRPEAPAEVPIAGDAETGSAFPRLDLPSKVDGRHLFAGDVRLPGMVHASVRHGPVGQTELTQFDEAAAARIRGLVGVVRAKRWIAAVAESWWQADRALTQMRPQFAGPGPVDSVSIAEQLDDALEAGEGGRIATIGEPDEILANPSFTARYEVSPALHNGIETASATASYVDGRLELWIASQVPEAAREAAARAIGIGVRDVVLYPMSAGGSFDARLEKQHAIEAAQIAFEIGRPVQLTWPREEEAKVLPPRAPAAIRMTARTDGEGSIAALGTRIACPPTMREFGRRLFDNNTPEAALRAVSGEIDPLACEGALPPYGLAAVAIDHVPVELDLPTGPLRGNAHGYTVFALECFVDELAREARRDPFLYRMAMLGQQPRMAAVLRRATRLGDWDGGQDGSGQGLAMVQIGDGDRAGHIACVVEARQSAGGFRVTRMSAVVDIGRIVNMDIARQQIEGGLVFGLSLAMGSSAEWRDGIPQPSRLGSMALPTLADTPQMAIDFVSSDAPPFDPGELGTIVAPPAIANALSSATQLRFRRLPLLSEGF